MNAGFDFGELEGFGQLPGVGPEEVIGMVLLMFLIPMLIGFVVGLVLYIFESIGLYKLAKNCRLPAPGLAWVPIANGYVLGRLAEISDRTVGKKSLPYRVILPLLEAFTLLMSVVTSFFGVILAVRTVELERTGDIVSLEASIGVLLVVLGLLMLVVIAASVFLYLALYRVYRLFAPENAVAFIVVSILFSVTTPFFLFSLRRRQPGAPRPAAPQNGYYAQPPYGAPQQPYTAPWPNAANAAQPPYGAPQGFTVPQPPQPPMPQPPQPWEQQPPTE